MLLLRNKDQQ